MTTITKTRLNRRSESSTPSASGMVVSTIGTAPRSPAQDRNAQLARAACGETTALTTTDSGRATKVRTRPADDRQADDLPGELVGRQLQAEHDEEPDLRQPGHTLGERAGGRAVRELAVAEHQRGDVHGGEAGAVHGRRGAVREEGEGEHRQRVEAGRRQRGPAHHPGTAEAAGQPEQRRRPRARRR